MAAGICAAALLMASPAHARSPKDIPAADFFKRAAIQAPSLSPNGKKVAVLIGGNAGRVGLAVADVGSPTKLTGIARFDDADVRSFRWVNDDRLVFDAIDLQAGLGNQQGSGLYAVNADGSEFVWLVERNGNYRPVGVPAVRPLPSRYRLHSTLDDGSSDVVAERFNFLDGARTGSTTLVRLNTKTMVTRPLVSFAPPGAQSWVMDRKGQPRAVISGDEKSGISVYWRAESSEDWSVISRYDAYDPGPGSIQPTAIDYEGRLYVTARQDNPERTLALFRFDTERKALESKPVVSLKGFDFEGGMLFDGQTRKVLGVTFVSDAPGTVWFDEDMKKVQGAVDKLLPNTVNTVVCKRCSSAAHFVVTASSDRQSSVYFLYDRQAAKLQLIGASRPWLDAGLMAEVDFVRIKARDGMEIPVYVTKPKGKGPFPTVVLIHGGPYVRGAQWGFDPEPQFFASRGYLVVEPEFRGSTGYGDTLFRAGWKQWGLKMQDDMTDAARWAIASGLADPKRVAIAGGSYGGYAAMMGLVKEPELFKAGLNFVGVTDIGLMYEIGWSDFLGGAWSRFGMPKLIGDPKADAEQLRNTSPLQQAGKIKQPVFMAYGEDDLRVPLPHGTRMRDALKAAGNSKVEWVQYADEGHGFLLEKNRIDFYSRMERFLAEHLK